MENKFFFKSVSTEPIFKGIYNDPMKDLERMALIVTKGDKPHRQRNWGDDPNYDAVMRNFGRGPQDGTEQQLVFGWANVTVQEDGTPPVDYQGDVIPTDELESAAYNYVLNFGIANKEHDWGTDCGWVVESMMFTKEKMAALGIPDGAMPEGWWIGFYIPDPAVFAKVKSGDYNMFSIEGTGRRINPDENF